MSKYFHATVEDVLRQISNLDFYKYFLVLNPQQQA